MDAREALERLQVVARRDVLPRAAGAVGAGMGLVRSAVEAAKAGGALDGLPLNAVGLEALESRLVGDDFDERLDLLRQRYDAMGGDPFGFDPELARAAALACAFFHRLYFRTVVDGIEHVPEGPAILVANHSGQIPTDGVMIVMSLFLDMTPGRFARSMIDRWTKELPVFSTLLPRVGQVVGSPENARRLLDMGELVLVFPEGTRGISKPFNKRYQLEPFRSGFMRLALEQQVPVVPIAVIGAEEQYLNVGNVPWAARALKMPAFPLLPQVLLPGGALPLPTRYRLHFGEPLRFEGDPGDQEQVTENAWLVQQTVQRLVNEGLKVRRSVFF